MKTTGKSMAVHWRVWVGAIPGLGALLLPVGVCPLCWPAYVGVVSALGLGFLLEETYLLVVTGAFLFVAVASLAYRANSRRGFGPFYLGAFGSALASAGKFMLSLNSVLYLGLILLVTASLWNAWPKPSARSCAACVAQESK